MAEAGAVTESAPATPRKRAAYLGVPLHYKLELACQHLAQAFGETPYLVGSSLVRQDWRDIDVVMILADDDFRAQFPNAGPVTGHQWEFDAKWLLMSIMISEWLTHQCGAPVDFKFQPRTWANEQHKGRRNAMGLIFARGDEA